MLGVGGWEEEAVKSSDSPLVGAHAVTSERNRAEPLEGGRLALGRICQHSSISGLPHDGAEVESAQILGQRSQDL